MIEPLAGILAELREADGNPATGPIFRGLYSGQSLNLNNFRKWVLSPLLKAAKIEWHGWYSLRRGVATTVASLSKDPMAAKGLLRHSSLTTTAKHYIKDVPQNTQEAMNQLEKLFNDCSTTRH